MSEEVVRVKGYREFQRALSIGDKEIKKRVRATLKEAGESIRSDAANRLSRYDAGSAAGLRVAVRMRGIAVEQSRRRVTGRRPDFGSLQMNRALIPARADKEPEVVRDLEKAMDAISLLVETV